MTRGLKHDLLFNKPTHYILDYSDYHSESKINLASAAILIYIRESLARDARK